MADNQEQYNDEGQHQHQAHFEEERGRSFNWKWILYGVVGLFVVGNMFFGSDDEGQDYYEEKFQEPTGGLITEIKEMKADEFKITDETEIANREDSRIIATFLDGAMDTFSLDEATLTTHTDPRRSMMRTVLMGGMMGYFMGNRMSSPTRASSYANKATHDRVRSTTGKSMASKATTRTVRKPMSSKKGYGSGKSTKSYGG